MIPIGKAVKIERTRNNFGSKELAARAKITRQMVWKIETGTTIPTIETIERLAVAFGISPSALIYQAEVIGREACKRREKLMQAVPA